MIAFSMYDIPQQTATDNGRYDMFDEMIDEDFTAMLLQWAAQDAAELAQWNAKRAAESAYYALVKEIDLAWAVICATDTDVTSYITDPCVDSENAESAVYESLAYWQLMCASAASAAGMRAEEAGYDINKVIGRSIY